MTHGGSHPLPHILLALKGLPKSYSFLLITLYTTHYLPVTERDSRPGARLPSAASNKRPKRRRRGRQRNPRRAPPLRSSPRARGREAGARPGSCSRPSSFRNRLISLARSAPPLPFRCLQVRQPQPAFGPLTPARGGPKQGGGSSSLPSRARGKGVGRLSCQPREGGEAGLVLPPGVGPRRGPEGGRLAGGEGGCCSSCSSLDGRVSGGE